jgi:hypothetical protein
MAATVRSPSSLGMLGARLHGSGDRRAGSTRLMSRFVDLLMAIPTLIFALVVLSVLPRTLVVLILVMGGPRRDPRLPPRPRRGARHQRSWTSWKRRVCAAKAPAGSSSARSCPTRCRRWSPNFGLRFIFAVLFLSALSFLGLGIQPPEADWGGMVKDNKDGIVFGISAALIPAGAIAVLAISRQPRRRLGPEPHLEPQGRARLMAGALKTEKPDTLLDIRNLRIEATVYPPGEAPKHRHPRATTSRSTLKRARCSASSANPARASRPSACPRLGTAAAACASRAARSCSTAATS